MVFTVFFCFLTLSGETHFDEMYKTLLDHRKEETLLGSFSFEPHVLPIFYRYKEAIDQNRTINLVLKAKENELKVPYPDHPNFYEVPRNLSPIVPIEWLMRGFVFINC